jgi:hypothetical protein
MKRAIAKSPHQSRVLGDRSPIFFHRPDTASGRLGDDLETFDSADIS